MAMAVTVEEIQRLVAGALGLKRVAADDLILEDLGAESADVVAIVAAVEERYGVMIAERELPEIRSVADLAARIRGGGAG